jgi:plastocyanin
MPFSPRRSLFPLALALLAGLPAGAAEVVVNVSSNVFSPRNVTIAPGDTVTWRNQGGLHDTVSDTGVWDSGGASSAMWTFSHTFGAAGTFPYFCSVHGGPGGVGMAGSVQVVGASAPGSVAFSAASVAVGESAGSVRLTVRRLSGSDGAISVAYNTAAGNATAGADFTASSGVLQWAAGDSADKTITVPILGDTQVEGAEAFAVALSAATGGATLVDPAVATVTITDDDGAVGPCIANANTLCLQHGRFRLNVAWTNQFDGSSGVGGVIPATDLSGYFFFTSSDNIELIVKTLDFGDVIKIFYGQLTNLHFVLTVTDTTTGAVKVYQNGPNDCGDIDQAAFPSKSRRWQDKWVSRHAEAGHGKAGTCVPTATRLCLLDQRFAVEVTWRNQFNGESGSGARATINNLVGTFSFTDPANVELMTKALDFGGGRILFIYGALSDLEYTITLTDTTTGDSKTYHNPGGTFCGGLDNDAF